MDIFELKREMGKQVTQIQRESDISLFELSAEIFEDENMLIEVFDSFDQIYKLSNELSKRCLNDFEF